MLCYRDSSFPGVLIHWIHTISKSLTSTALANFVELRCLFIVDVIALAGALGELATSIPEARSALWSALQLASIDLPARCLNAAKETAAKQKVSLEPRHSAGTMAAGWSNKPFEVGGDVLTDAEDLRKEDKSYQ